MLHLTVLGSGSSGNSAVISSGNTTLLLDAGLSAKQIVIRLESIGLTPASLDGILLTHEHLDHVRGLEVLSRALALPIFCTALTQEHLLSSLKFRTAPAWRIMQTGSAFDFQDVRIECFPVLHDAVDPVGYVVADQESRLGVLSDVGKVTNLVRDRLRGSDTLFIEANYDTQLLDADTKRPWATKQRIWSPHGHLSNDQTAEVIADVAHAQISNVILGHLSGDCNDPDLAARRMRSALDSVGAVDARVLCAERHKPTPTIQVARQRPRVHFQLVTDPGQSQLQLF